MRKHEIELPESAEEFLETVQAKRAVIPVLLRGRRFLKITYELAPRIDCEGYPMSEEVTNCPVCGWKV